ncbi:hypothetical protein A3863_10350 [Priestia endophytica]|uniref:hypothetical protein n=1 Tax=Priestia endophytica TaxID=135735 RepID=UPI000DCA7AF3|nr:hypothetical protein [Priestia endophytica]RAS89612.1 hypothetical protein A3863_10350 [Priestia endophytica]
MPEVGHRETVNAFTLDAEARGGIHPTTARDNKEYEPPEGYILINHREIREVSRGNATASTGTAPAGYRIINTDDIEGDFDSHTEWRYAEVWGQVDVDAQWNNVRRQVEEYQKFRRRLTGNAIARGEFAGAGAHIRVRVEAVIEYVGTAADTSQYINKMLASANIPDVRLFEKTWKTIQEDARFEYKQGSSTRWWDYDLYMQSTKPELDNHFVYYSMGGKVGVYRFLPTLKTEGSPREVVILLQEQSSGSGDILGSNKKTINVTTTNTKYEVAYTKQRGDSTLFAFIYWADDRIEPIILDNYWTFIVYP